MRLEYQILIAFALDLLIGDPRWLPHPVRGIGWLAQAVESPLRRLIPWERGAGIMAVLVVLLVTGGIAYGSIVFAGWIHPLAGDLISILWLYTAFATRDLAQHAHRVFRALRNGDLDAARRQVGMIVGRDTHELDEKGIVRATVESIAESLVDGVTAPLFFATLGGPVGAMAYKAMNTLDSTFGYKTERYYYFGWASARLDDVANWIPARLTAPLLAMVSVFFGGSPMRALRTFWRDGAKHASPNSGLSEAAMAGALEIQLGGLNYYGGEPCDGPRFGEAIVPLERNHIAVASGLLFATAIVAVALFLGMRLIALSWFGQGGLL